MPLRFHCCHYWYCHMLFLHWHFRHISSTLSPLPLIDDCLSPPFSPLCHYAIDISILRHWCHYADTYAVLPFRQMIFSAFLHRRFQVFASRQLPPPLLMPPFSWYYFLSLRCLSAPLAITRFRRQRQLAERAIFSHYFSPWLFSLSLFFFITPLLPLRFFTPRFHITLRHYYAIIFIFAIILMPPLSCHCAIHER